MNVLLKTYVFQSSLFRMFVSVCLFEGFDCGRILTQNQPRKGRDSGQETILIYFGKRKRFNLCLFEKSQSSTCSWGSIESRGSLGVALLE